MMVESIVAMYQKGAITADHLVVRCLQEIDPADPASVLEVLPEKFRSRLLEFAREYRPGLMISSYGPLPTADQVAAAARWIEAGSKVAPAAHPGS